MVDPNNEQSFVSEVGQICGWYELCKALKTAHHNVLDWLSGVNTSAVETRGRTVQFLILLERRLNLLRHEDRLWEVAMAQDERAICFAPDPFALPEPSSVQEQQLVDSHFKIQHTEDVTLSVVVCPHCGRRLRVFEALAEARDENKLFGHSRYTFGATGFGTGGRHVKFVRRATVIPALYCEPEFETGDAKAKDTAVDNEPGHPPQSELRFVCPYDFDEEAL